MPRLIVKETAEPRGFENSHQLALAAGVSASVVREMWQGNVKRIDLATLGRIAQALGVDPGALIVKNGD